MDILFNQETILMIICVIVFLAYNYYLFEFADSILETPKLIKRFRIPVGILNSALTFAFMYVNLTTFFAYILMAIVLTLEFYLFYSDRISRVFFVAGAYLIHIMAARSIIIATMALILDVDVFYISNNTNTLVISSIITFLLLALMTKAVMLIIPGNKIKLINQHDDQFWLVAVLVFICELYLIINATIFDIDETHSVINLMQIVTPIVLLIFAYIGVFYTVRNTILLGYKEKNVKLQTEIDKEHMYKDSVVQGALASYEFNLSTDQVLNSEGIIGEHVDVEFKNNYTKMLEFIAPELVYPEDVQKYIDYACRENLIKAIESGETIVILEYRRISSDGSDKWAKAVTSLAKEKATNEIKGITYVKDIDKEKRAQMELTYRAERDSLTGLYNKGTTNSIIVELLKNAKNTEMVSGMLIIDIDNFKEINDTFGHPFGDNVLCELATKLQKIFRSYDVVGRVGGDEFLVYLDDAKKNEDVIKKAEEVLKSFYCTYTNKEGKAITISASIGLAIVPSGGSEFADLYLSADIALYKAKAAGKNNYVIYSGQEFGGYKSNRTEIESLKQV